MPRRRMTDPFFWSDPKVGRLTRDERALVSGCMGHTDDNGRIEANPSYLKAMIFKYDDDLDIAAVKALRDTCLSKMESWPVNHPYRMKLYSNAGEEYIFFPAFSATNKPSHPTVSQLPAPPLEILQIFSGANPEERQNASGGSQEPLANSSLLGQVSLVKESIGQVRVVQEDFTKFLDNEKDLTDFTTMTLQKYAPAGVAWITEVLKKLWQQATGEKMSEVLFTYTFTHAVREYSPDVLARAYVKAVKYKGGKAGSWKYVQKILEEKAHDKPS